MSELRLYCASLVGYTGTTISNQTTHVIAKNDTDAFKKAYKVFERMYHDNKIKNYISCIELSSVEGYKINVC